MCMKKNSLCKILKTATSLSIFQSKQRMKIKWKRSQKGSIDLEFSVFILFWNSIFVNFSTSSYNTTWNRNELERSSKETENDQHVGWNHFTRNWKKCETFSQRILKAGFSHVFKRSTMPLYYFKFNSGSMLAGLVEHFFHGFTKRAKSLSCVGKRKSSKIVNRM